MPDGKRGIKKNEHEHDYGTFKFIFYIIIFTGLKYKMGGYSGNYHYILFTVSYHGVGKAHKGVGVDEGYHHDTRVYLVRNFV